MKATATTIIDFKNVLQVNSSGDVSISGSNVLTLSQNAFSSKQPPATLPPYPYPRGMLSPSTTEASGKTLLAEKIMFAHVFLKPFHTTPVKPPSYPTQVAILIPSKKIISMYSREAHMYNPEVLIDTPLSALAYCKPSECHLHPLRYLYTSPIEVKAPNDHLRRHKYTLYHRSLSLRISNLLRQGKNVFVIDNPFRKICHNIPNANVSRLNRLSTPPP